MYECPDIHKAAQNTCTWHSAAPNRAQLHSKLLIPRAAIGWDDSDAEHSQRLLVPHPPRAYVNAGVPRMLYPGTTVASRGTHFFEGCFNIKIGASVFASCSHPHAHIAKQLARIATRRA